MISKLGQVMVCIEDQDKAVHFWTEKMGFLMFYTTEIEKLYVAFKEKGITSGEFVDMASAKVFNFTDEENNYFAVMEE